MKSKKLGRLLLSGAIVFMSAFNPIPAFCQEIQDEKQGPKIELNLEEALEKNAGHSMPNNFNMGGLNIQLSDSPKIFYETAIYKDARLFTELYYQKNNSENIIGTNARLQFRNIELGLGGKICISDSYSFNRYGVNSAFGIDLKLFKLGIGYGMDIDASNNQIGNSFSFNVSFSLD